MLQIERLYIPTATIQEANELFEQLDKQIAEYKTRHPKESWRKAYFLHFPEMNNVNGVNKLNNLIALRRFDADILRSLDIFFKSVNK